ncbi:MAG: 3-phosphoshikimate 1-carboxyvinyltransferase [Spirochaetota bacterium]
MAKLIHPGAVSGTVEVPSSKSHTIRALLIATLASGESTIRRPLDSKDARSCINACRLLGAEIEEVHGSGDGTAGDGPALTGLVVRGVGGSPQVPPNVIDVGNSGTTLYLAASVAALAPGWTVFTGDAQIRRRPIRDLLQALESLGARAFTTREADAAPVCIQGPLAGGRATISCPTSQYLSSLLLAAPLAAATSEISVPLLNEKPYVEMTLWWLDGQGIRYERDGYDRFTVPGGQAYRPFDTAVPGDFSSATFFFAAAAVTGSTLDFDGLDMSDPQGDKEVLKILSEMGCRVETLPRETDSGDTGSPGTAPPLLRVAGPDGPLGAGTFDLNSIPDALPALAVAACYADGETRLLNVPQARLKETDRIAVMATELAKMGADVDELPDGLVIRGRAQAAAGSTGRKPGLRGASVESHDDHRVSMALAVAALGATGPTEIAGWKAAEVTYPAFFSELRRLTAR